MFLDVYYDGNPVTPNDPLVINVLFILSIVCLCLSVVCFVKFLKEDKKNKKSRNKLFTQTIISLILGISLMFICLAILNKYVSLVIGG